MLHVDVAKLDVDRVERALSSAQSRERIEFAQLVHVDGGPRREREDEGRKDSRSEAGADIHTFLVQYNVLALDIVRRLDGHGGVARINVRPIHKVQRVGARYN